MCKIVKRRFVKSTLKLCWVGEEVEDTGSEITSQTRSTFRLADVDLEVGTCERAILNAASSRTTKGTKAKDVLSRSKFNVFTVATEASGRREDFCLERLCRIAVVGLCVKRPVPVPVRC